ncbi:MAG: tRNA uridine-5-carboxymethylaminomethyl(34) synthesis enzyme MnmG [Candidatus Cloacimonetes bacterium]|nr:tRNA uridine-5-carboxymethylaminomethyl(34) synthesis enzyme MnmG [Candidatus Cloacimonadota bacterium]
MMTNRKYDIIVVGAGHAGIEAALAAARRGARTALFVIKLESVGRMSCNPSFGGPAKGHLAKEIDALGGELGWCADQSGIHFRMLNRKKGPAVWAPRSQNDRRLYSELMLRTLEEQDNLELIESTVTAILHDDKAVQGVITNIGLEYFAPKIILAPGTFLRGSIYVGDKVLEGGRSGEPSANELSLALSNMGFELLRFKTGTPPRVDLRSLDYSALEEQPGDPDPSGFSHYRDIKLQNLISCYLTRTTPQTHEIISQNIASSALYGGIIQGIGARYCPSIEDKIVKFPQRDTHQVFIEPEGIHTYEGYVNGVSTSLPPQIQEQIIHSIPGMQNARIMRYAYAIEYDCISGQELDASLMSKRFDGLYLAGQINGTSGYEEAAAQGILAGINATLALEDKPPLILSRSQAYMGVLVDDLITRGTNEPYRMFTSRAEYRLMLRQDNADERLMPLGYQLGLIPATRWQRYQTMLEIKEREWARLHSEKSLFSPTEEDGLPREPQAFAQLLKRPQINFADLSRFGFQPSPELTQDIASRIQLEIKYSGYLSRAQMELQRFNDSEHIHLPADLDYYAIQSIAWEAREKLASIRPRNIAQALRIPGVNYTDAAALMIWLKKHHGSLESK